MSQRRQKSTKSASSDHDHTPNDGATAHRPDGEAHRHNGHSHSHSLFGHSHSHDEHDHGHDAEQIVQAFQRSGDRGSRITLIGLFANIGLTGAKGAAGVYMHSASLLADAGHSLSDLLGDFVTLFCWKLSRKPPSKGYPYGFAKFETLGTTTVSLLLIGGALGIGFHSYHLLIEALSSSVSTLPPGTLHDLLQYVTSAAHHVPAIGHSHGHVDVLDPNAAWFAAVSVIAKEWLYRVTKKVADEERSPVLYANAIHHRSDAYSSIVALFAILGSWFFPALPLDPIGGLLVSIVILQQGLSLFRGAFTELTDAGISTHSHAALQRVLDPLLSPLHASTPHSSSNGLQDTIPRLISIRDLRAKRAGSLISVDLTADVPSALTVLATSELEEKITRTLKNARKEISEVRVKFNPVDADSLS
ncbi:cation efflux protein [Leucogyrophana mollusca]|uniref:Cation efflux protein n=1 Tax=Leucogyrophana mollusca TaxID=85980 RepID=A0ACB8B3E7_9AGAM|nr:cation efflux protein [Leucogyrophana mollusca]